jgi:hypothetical protein
MLLPLPSCMRSAVRPCLCSSASRHMLSCPPPSHPRAPGLQGAAPPLARPHAQPAGRRPGPAPPPGPRPARIPGLGGGQAGGAARHMLPGRILRRGGGVGGCWGGGGGWPCLPWRGPCCATLPRQPRTPRGPGPHAPCTMRRGGPCPPALLPEVPGLTRPVRPTALLSEVPGLTRPVCPAPPRPPARCRCKHSWPPCPQTRCAMCCGRWGGCSSRPAMTL